ncbi:MAG: peptidoglycan-binding protein [Burkholderiales bacterium]
MPDTDTKTLFTLTRYNQASNGTVTVDKTKSFSVMINPAEISLQSSIGYSRVKTLGQTRSEMKFSAYGADEVKFSIVLDGTAAAVPAGSSADRKDVKVQIDNLFSVVYDYVGDKHEPSRVRLLWGSVIFFGRLSNISTQYTLFKRNGDPLRAKVEMKFAGSVSKAEDKLTANRSSPDLSHVIEVKRGDTLPLLCNSIYGDPGYYPEVARFNNLVSFRDLRPGTRLHFPPLE